MSRLDRFKKSTVIVLAFLVVTMGCAVLLAPKASASYQEHSLIDSGFFLNAASMSQADIQAFLQARGGYLANYYSYSDRDGGNVIASRVIYEAAQDYGISPKVLLATLQKEQSLVTAKSPTQSQLNFAMGYGCPDSAECQAKYGSFYKQVDNAAWQFRFNYERANGNNSWWRVGLSYPCGGATRYYSTGLYPGRSVTFYDDNGTAYKTFVINNAATSSLYCYTPHAYNNPNGLYGNPQFGYTGQYYSGSYNFVRFYEGWFGSTQPDLTVASPLRISSVHEGVYSGIPTTVSFDLGNSTGVTKTVSVAVTVRGSGGTNQDFALKSVTVPPWGWATYSDTRTLPTEDTYTFGLTSYVNGSWDDNYPASSHIDNPRSAQLAVRAAPTISVAPAVSGAAMRIGKSATVTFTVRNNSAQPMDVGKVAVAMRSPQNTNSDLPLRATGVIAAGGTYVYSESFMPTMAGQYTGFITSTKDNGTTWNNTNYPYSGTGVQRTLASDVKPSPTLTQGPTLSVASPRVGQQVTASFKVKNFGDATANAGYIGLAIRDPLGRNVDAGSVNLSIGGGDEYTFQATPAFQTPGTYTAWITSFHNGYWDDVGYPVAESGAVMRKVTFEVKPSPTLTQGPTLSVASPRVGQQVTTSFKIKNFGSSTANVGYVGLAIRDPLGRNVDAGGNTVSINASNEYAFAVEKVFQVPGTYTAWITSFHNGYWDDVGYPVAESGAVARKITFTVSASPVVMSSGLQSSVASPAAGQQYTLSFKVKNTSAVTINYGYIGLAGRDGGNRNIDPGSQPLTLNANEEKTVSFNVTRNTAGAVRYFVTSTPDFALWYDGPAPETSGIAKTLNLTIQ